MFSVQFLACLCNESSFLTGCSVTDGYSQAARPCSDTAINIITISKLSLRSASAPSVKITPRSADSKDPSSLVPPL